jgi:hypothetical protein
MRSPMESARLRVRPAPLRRESTVPAWAAGLVLALAAGVFLRLLWPGDIEYRNDQLWLFNLTQQAGRSMSWPWLGLPSSAQILAPGASVWAIIGLARIGGVTTPTGLGMAIKVLNCIALILLVGFAYWLVAAQERELWLWAAAFEAVNPVCVWLERKIWQPSIFPIFTLIFLAAWWRRARPWPAFFWGLIGALLGQIQGSGFFFAGGLALWAWIFDRRRVAWKSWLAGSVIGALPMIPWVVYMAHQTAQGGIPRSRWHNVLDPRFYTAWFSIPFGVNLHDPLGPKFYAFLKYPLIGGIPTFGVAVLHLILLGIACSVLCLGVIHLWLDRGNWRVFLIGRESETAFTQQAALIGFGALMTFSGLPGHIHYMIIIFPLIFVWLARTVLHETWPFPAAISGRQLLAMLCALQFLLSFMFLAYIHQNHGAPGGDFGVVCQECAITD